MTIFAQNSMFPTFNKFIKFGNGAINVTNGANTLSSLSLCSVKIPFEQYQKMTILLPKGQTDFLVSAPMMGIKTTFIVIRPKFCCSNTTGNYLKWKFQNSNDPKMTMTNILVLSGSTTNPIPPIVLDNPNTTCDVEVEILISAMGNDYLNDINAFLYLNDLTFDLINAATNIFSFYNSSNELAGTLDISDIVNIIKVPSKNRIIIDESSDHNIVLDFKTDMDTLQALSAINWFLLDPLTRTLPQPKDEIAPVITYTDNIVDDTTYIYLGPANPPESATWIYTLNSYTQEVGPVDATFSIDGDTFQTDISSAVTIEEVIDIIEMNWFLNDYIFTKVDSNTFKITSPEDLGGTLASTDLTITNIDAVLDVFDPGFAISYGESFTKSDFITHAILNIVDARDGQMIAVPNNITFKKMSIVSSVVTYTDVPLIDEAGTYLVEIKVSDIAGNIVTKNIDLIANV